MISRPPDDRNLPLRLAISCGGVVAVALFSYAQHGPLTPGMIAFFIGGFLGAIVAAVVDDRWEQEMFGKWRMLFLLGAGGGGLLGAGLWELFG